MNAGDEFVIDCILAESSIEDLWAIRAAARDEIKRRMAGAPATRPPQAARRETVELDPTPKGHFRWIN